MAHPGIPSPDWTYGALSLYVETPPSVRAAGVSCALETSGHAPEADYRAVVSRMAFVYQDLKHHDADAFRRWCGGDLALVLRNLAWLRESGVPFAVRVPCIPGVNDAPADREAFLRLAGPGTAVDFLPVPGCARIRGMTTKKRAPARVSTPSADHTARRVLLALWMGCDFGRDAIEGVRRALAARGLAWRIRFTNTEAAFRAAVRWMLRERRIEGAITCFPLPDAMAALRRAGVPAVLIDRGDAPPPQTFGRHVARVTLDVPAVARATVDHFLERAAFRSAGFVESFIYAGWSRLRGDACLAEFARRGLRRGARFRHRRSAEPDFDRLAAWIRALEKPAAVSAANDATAADVLDLCEAEGVAVPRDVAVLGMDDDPAFCLRCEPNLSSVHFDGVAAGRLAADALASMMAGGAAPPESALRYGATAVVRRASTGAVSTAGALVQKAVDFIEANALRGISLSDVVRHLGVSRALATRRFRQLRGESVLDAIAARRIAEARRLLADTDRRVDDIARACGYSGAGPLRRAFLAATGSTPGAFRAAVVR